MCATHLCARVLRLLLIFLFWWHTERIVRNVPAIGLMDATICLDNWRFEWLFTAKRNVCLSEWHALRQNWMLLAELRNNKSSYSDNFVEQLENNKLDKWIIFCCCAKTEIIRNKMRKAVSAQRFAWEQSQNKIVKSVEIYCISSQ